MVDKILPVLSGSLAEILRGIYTKTSNEIVKEILDVHEFVESYNTCTYSFTDEFGKSILEKVIEPRITDEVRMITVRAGEFEVSFLPKGKVPEYNNGDWARKNRQLGKPAKIFQKLLKREFKTRDWEIFSNLFKAELCACANFQLVEGERIRELYLCDNYYQCDGTLGNSCMRYEEAQSYFDVYVDNARMLVTTKDDKLTGRALVWKVGDITLMDRIYTCFDYLENCFINYAKEQGWWIRRSNSLLSSGEDQVWLSPKDNYAYDHYDEFSIKLDTDYELFPYMDSFRYYDLDDKTIYTCYSRGRISLDSTDGSFRGESYECAHCGHISWGYDGETPDDMHYSDWFDAYYCDDCCWYSDGLDDWFPITEDQIEVYDAWLSVNLYPQCAFEDHFVEHPIGDESYGDIVKIDDDYYIVSQRLKFNTETQQYEIRSNTR